ncbi:Nucleolar 14 [Chlorella sorokiniana]|uniref:Nucleolar 14 n=1 Tax=Chlorella sorokiniana TaxID=3076 RepID=A0A2P6TTC6_CHLSO|nr:Nucleolar 14 [Chlorella sorokiniana]|eukprot:PRW57304.1 Nucleolar 14 [Chlorella sorokiniana]
MGKGKKRKAPSGVRGGERGAPEPPPNLFERLSNRKRFDILGRKVKGETKQLGKLRSAATEKRKSTLLVEYRQLRKSNAFIDRRFGEDDESLTAEEKALLRFQKQRLKEMAGSKFALPDEDGEGLGGGEQLTHLGRSLDEMDEFGGRGWGSDDEGDARLDEELTRDYHFGGGLFEKKAAAGEGEEGEGEDGEGRPHKKSKKEVMEEIIAKSKAFKAERQRQREEDQDETDALDDQFKALLGDRALLGLMRKKGEKRTHEDQAFDVLTRELVFEAKAKPGERTLTAEELAELERQRLEALETQRRRRQESEEGASEDEDGEEGGAGAGAAALGAGGALPGGGYAARRAKRARAEERGARRLGGGASGDALEDDWATGSDSEGSDGSDEGGSSGSEDEEGSSDEEGLTELERRRRRRAAGDHPLQDAFRKASSKLLKKHRAEAGEDVSSEEEEEEEEEEGGSGSEEEEEEEEAGRQQRRQQTAAAAAAEEEQEEEAAGGSSGSEQEEEVGSGSEEEGSEGSEEEEEAAPRGGDKAAAGAPAAPAAARPALPPGVSADLPYTPPMPDSYEAFAQLAAGRSAADLGELVRRMRVVHAAALNSESRKGLQLLYGILVQHFASLAGGSAEVDAAAGSKLPLQHLDALVPHLVELTPQVPFYAATLARARLQRAQERLAESLRDVVERADAWPPARVLLLLKLFATVFPASDKRHPVLTPAGLLICSCLSNCPLARPQHVGAGLFLASLAVHLHSQAQRFVPEPLTFATQLLQSVLPEGAAPPPAPSHQRALAPEQPRWLAVSAADEGAANLPASEEDILPLPLAQVLGGSGSDAFWRSAAFKTSAAAAAVRLVLRQAELLGGNAALPEILAPALEALRAIVAAASGSSTPQQDGGQPPACKKQRGKQQHQAAAPAAPAALVAPGLAALCRRAIETLEASAAAAQGARRPLFNVHLLKVAEKKQYNPRFEEDFVSGKDYDPDRERAERRKLQRAIRQEERGAARELRRDAAFMAEARDREKAAKQAELFASEKRAKAFLQQQAADMRSGGQGGMWKKKKK